MTGDEAKPAGRRGSEPPWVGEVLRFWFEDLTYDAWFTRSDETDALITSRFLDLYRDVAAEPVEAALSSPKRALATVIVLDQFPRNMFRGTPKAFATDAKAREVASAALERGLDDGYDVHARAFLYLPFEHSERLEDQERSVALYAALGDAEYTRYAIAHRDIIARFGRFPHRNAALGRPSTLEETEFLKQQDSSF